MQTGLVSPWLGTVAGENRTRNLRIKAVAQKTAETFLLEAENGYSDERQTAVKAEIEQIGQERKLLLVTQADSKIVATQTPNGMIAGMGDVYLAVVSLAGQSRNLDAYRLVELRPRPPGQEATGA